MRELNLEGAWMLQDGSRENKLEGYLPGCNYLDLMNGGIIEDAFYSSNEKKVRWIAERDWEYSRYFNITADIFLADFIFLSISGADTIIDVYINNKLVTTLQNAYIDYKINIKEHIVQGKNSIKFYIYSPINFITEKQKYDKMPYNFAGIRGYPHIRKPACHFGWDWGPVLPPSGVSGHIKILAYNAGYIEDLRVRQRVITLDKAELELKSRVIKGATTGKYYYNIIIKDKNKKILLERKEKVLEQTVTEYINIINPELWSINNGDGEQQPLYYIQYQLLYDNIIIDQKKISIGIREIVLETQSSKGEYAKQFAFRLNGKRIFAKGGNWIPPDSFITRKTKDDLEYLIRSCVKANMNMIRVWGGGYYESDDFYHLCDKYGILVWQDFAFACQPYPFFDEQFLNNVKQEVISVTKRLHHHACLCLWCGNNEIEALTLNWFWKKRLVLWTRRFFYEILPNWLEELGTGTPYWYGSPSSGKFMSKVSSDRYGDTHIWNVWHGLMSFKHYSKRYTKFCSEFGFESLPNIDTIKEMAPADELDLFSQTLLSHQKNKGGNEKIIYYMIDNFCIPKKFEQLVYISQLVQAESIKTAVTHWRKHSGICNGALYWQINDCWPALSWSSIDYYGRWKALQYYARRFFSPIVVHLNCYKDMVMAFLINDTADDIIGNLNFEVVTFDGKIVYKNSVEVNLESSSCLAALLPIERGVKKNKHNIFAYCSLTDNNGIMLSHEILLFCKTNKLNLPKADIDIQLSKLKNIGYKLSLQSNTFAKSVYVHINNYIHPLSDNFFDLRPFERKRITIETNKEITKEDINIICYNNVTSKYSKVKEKLIKMKIITKPINLFSRILYKFL